VVRGGKLLMVGAPDELRMRTGGPGWKWSAAA
jgi:hypothetical protein